MSRLLQVEVDAARAEQADPLQRSCPALGHLKEATTKLSIGYVRRNGVPHNKHGVVNEYYDLRELGKGDQWFTVTKKRSTPRHTSAIHN